MSHQGHSSDSVYGTVSDLHDGISGDDAGSLNLHTRTQTDRHIHVDRQTDSHRARQGQLTLCRLNRDTVMIELKLKLRRP